MRLRIRVTPRASRDAIQARAGVLLVRVTAPAIEGRANDAARRVLADALGVRASDVVIETGARSRHKLVRLPDSAAERLAILLRG